MKSAEHKPDSTFKRRPFLDRVIVSFILLGSACAPSQPTHPVGAQPAEIEITDPTLTAQKNGISESLSSGNIWIELQERFDHGSSAPQETIFIKAAFFKPSTRNPLFHKLVIPPQTVSSNGPAHSHNSHPQALNTNQTIDPNAESAHHDDTSSEKSPHSHRGSDEQE